MADRVASPSSPETGRLSKLLGTYVQTVAGDYVVTPPPGTRWARIMLRGAGGGGGGNASDSGARGGGEGALQRRLVRLRALPFAVTIGAGGKSADAANGLDGGPSSALGYVARAGRGGQQRGEFFTDSGGAGADGPDPLFGYGEFSGRSAPQFAGGGRMAEGVPLLGAGGSGIGIQQRPQRGEAGADGYLVAEFYG